MSILAELLQSISELGHRLGHQLIGGRSRLVLSAGLKFRSGEAFVVFQLDHQETSKTDEPVRLLDWQIRYDAFVSAPDGGALSVQAPAAFKTALADHVPADHPKGEPVWLRLTRPYGMLPAFPWERILADCLGRPVVRLPDFSIRAAERPDILECALIVDAGHEAAAEAILRRARIIADALVKASSRATTRVHVFPHGRYAEALGVLKTGNIEVHVPPSGAPVAGSPPRPAIPEGSATSLQAPLSGNPWADWIATSIGQRSLDAVVLLCRAERSDGTAELVVSRTPISNSPALLSIGVDELQLLVDRAGAWATVLTPASADDRDALALVAEGFARARLGCVYFASASDEAGEREIEQIARLFFGKGPQAAPSLRDGFVYCSPSYVAHEHDWQVGTALDLLAKHVTQSIPDSPRARRTMSDLISILGSMVHGSAGGAAPEWQPASQRYIESAILDEIRRRAPDILLSTGLSKVDLDRISDTALDTLGEIQATFRQYRDKNRT